MEQELFGSGDKVRLSGVNTLTLYNGKMTTGRRSSPVKQLQCVGGSAGCSAFTPQVVQCYNRGSDGYDAQWECKSDMDNAYRFGSIEVTCEGYDHPDDEYVLKGSCGLEYTLDLTKEGMNNNQYKKQHSYYGNDNYGSSHDYYGSHKHSSGLGDWIMLAIVGVIIYGIYRTCVATSPTDSDYPDDQSGNCWGQGRWVGRWRGNPRLYSPGNSGGCSGTTGSSTAGIGSTGAGVGGGGFWTGAAAGGLLGYLFGNNRGYGGYNRGYGYNRPRYGYRSGYNSGWGGSGFGGFSRGGSSFGGGGGGFSSGTRTASGFGGTRRR
ncbi:store-operated calcium entry-associated regulatory factor-like [Amphiura filiformis]|uniref:store-operated calcium entry-associated regulatory factor-like n=1 Tax=Amphiura filiformis TaxID=82378 RepID=UPI003B21510B